MSRFVDSVTRKQRDLTGPQRVHSAYWAGEPVSSYPSTGLSTYDQDASRLHEDMLEAQARVRDQVQRPETHRGKEVVGLCFYLQDERTHRFRLTEAMD